MKKIIIFFILLLSQISSLLAWNLSVKTNLESWEYEFVIDVNIIANDKNAKIFYYTDWEWRMDNIKEFKKPIVIKEDTQLDYYATNKNYEDTLIQTSIYTFNYSKQIDIIWQENKIIIKNNSNKIQNIWYWQIEANNLNYEIPPNTFLNEKETFEINYDLKDNENIKLISPDKKVVKNFVYKKKWKSKELPLKKINVGVDPLTTQENSISWNIEDINNNTKNLQEEIIKNEYIFTPEINKNEENYWFKLNENLKTSTIDTKKTWNKNNIYIIILIFLSLILYNVWLLLTKIKNSKKNKKK